MGKQYVLKAFPDFDTPYKYFIGFCYDSEFFNDILEIVSDNSVGNSLSFPIENDFFEIYEYANTTNLFNSDMLRDVLFAPIYGPKTIKKQFKKAKPRLHIYNNTFHFAVQIQNGTTFHTEDLTTEFIENLSSYYKDQYVEMVS